MGDITLDLKGESFTLNLKTSKTDPYRKGVEVVIFATGKSICPFSSMKKLMQIRKSYGARSYDPLFVDQRCRPVTRHMFLECLHIVLRHAGYGHSFRIGAATSAAEARIEDHLIKTLGRWTSDCYKRYIHTSKAVVKRAQISLCLCESTVQMSSSIK